MENNEQEILEQADITAEDKQNAPQADIDALQKSYRELQSAFTKKSQALKELEQKVNSVPSREEIIREYLLSQSAGRPAVLTSSSSAFDFAKEKKPTTLAAADRLARELFSQK